MNQQTAVVLGATGLVGSHVLEQLLNDDAFAKVRVLVRRPLNIHHPKLETEIVDFNNYDEYKAKLGKGDCIFCCIGTTNANVKGDKTEYRKIDFDIPVNAARFGKEAGFEQYLLISAMGANTHNRIFYSRLKGEVEELIATFGFNCFHIFRPSFLLGKRKEERRGESIFKAISGALAFITPSRYKPIEASVVAAAMVKAAKIKTPGMHINYYKEMMAK